MGESKCYHSKKKKFTAKVREKMKFEGNYST